MRFFKDNNLSSPAPSTASKARHFALRIPLARRMNWTCSRETSYKIRGRKKKFTWAKQQCFCFYCSLLIYFQKYLISCVHNYLNPSKIIISLALSFLSALNTPPASQAWQQANKWCMGLLERADPTWIPMLEQPLQDGSASYTPPAPQSQWSLGTA